MVEERRSFQLTTLTAKHHFLEGAGFAYSFDREVYFNRKAKMVFSREFVEDHAEKELEQYLIEAPAGPSWRFFFNTPPPESVKREIERVLG
jgi:hypothetical protein